MKRLRSPTESGVSLQEILLVLAVLGMAIVSVPNFNSFMKVLRARSAVNEMVGAMNLARQLSVRQRAGHVFLPLTGPAAWELRNVATGAVVREGELPTGVAHTALASFQFDTDGHCLNPTVYDGTTPVGQYLQVEAQIQSGRRVRYTLALSPLSRVTTTTEHLR